MKYLYLLPLGLALLTASCKNTTTASSNPYQSNPYYGPSGTTSDYSSTPSSTTYPTYSQSTYTPPATAAAAAAPAPTRLPTAARAEGVLILCQVEKTYTVSASNMANRSRPLKVLMA